MAMSVVDFIVRDILNCDKNDNHNYCYIFVDVKHNYDEHDIAWFNPSDREMKWDKIVDFYPEFFTEDCVYYYRDYSAHEKRDDYNCVYMFNECVPNKVLEDDYVYRR